MRKNWGRSVGLAAAVMALGMAAFAATDGRIEASSLSVPSAEVPVAEGAQVVTAPVGTVFVAATWGDNRVHFLDAAMADLGSFALGSSNPNGIATDGATIYVGHFSLPGVASYDSDGNFLSQWVASEAAYLQGMDLVNGDIAIVSDPSIHFFTTAGAYVRSIPSQGGTVEGLAFDGTVLWQLADSIVGTDPATGAVVRTIPNPAAGCTFGGTGLASSAPGELTVACTGGQWYRISSADGTVLSSGNNGLAMFGLKAFGSAAPPVTYELVFQDDLRGIQLCIDREMGVYQWHVPSTGATFSGTGVLANGGTAFWTVPEDPNYIYATYDSKRKRARAYFSNSETGLYYSIRDSNTANNAECGGTMLPPG
ncbi:MAG: hypothetical protein ACOYXN_04160 [Acidobacteriota bacterium]